MQKGSPSFRLTSTRNNRPKDVRLSRTLDLSLRASRAERLGDRDKANDYLAIALGIAIIGKDNHAAEIYASSLRARKYDPEARGFTPYVKVGITSEEVAEFITIHNDFNWQAFYDKLGVAKDKMPLAVRAIRNSSYS